MNTPRTNGARAPQSNRSFGEFARSGTQVAGSAHHQSWKRQRPVAIRKR